jgi:hypothetical protein
MVHPNHGRNRVKPVLITLGAALLVTVPATIGLVGNTSFARSVPVRVPAHATVVDEQSGQTPTNPNKEPKPARHIEPRDDHGGQRPAGSKRGEQPKEHQTGHQRGRGGPSQPHKGQKGTPAASSGSATSSGPGPGPGVTK